MEDKMAGAFGRAKNYGWDGFFESWRGGLYPGWGGAAAHNRKQLMGLKTSILVPRSFSLPAPPARTLWYEKITSRALFGIFLKKTVSCNSLFRFNLMFFFFFWGVKRKGVHKDRRDFSADKECHHFLTKENNCVVECCEERGRGSTRKHQIWMFLSTLITS